MGAIKSGSKDSSLSSQGAPALADWAFASTGGWPPPAAAAPLLPTSTAKEILVQFDGTAGAAGRVKALAAIGGQALEVLWTDGTGETGAQLLRVKLTGDIGIDKAIEMLSNRPGVTFAEPNFTLTTQATSNDPQFTNGALWGMHGDASGSPYGSAADEAWAAGYTGSSKTVVGVLDSGIDYRHPDLYQNVWLNQGEISATLRSALTDIDTDGLITFRDLNHVANQSSVSDLNANGYIDAGDLLADTRWENGADNDGNRYVDDLIGWDFVNNDNNPLDDDGHGTHVSGTIGGAGGNGVGVAGVNWSTQVMALKFMASIGGGSLANALKALDYYTNLSKAAPAASNFVGTNNSWTTGGLPSQSMQDAITRTGAAGNLFVTGAGNGGSDGVGDDNDTVANYPSNYSTESTLGWDAVVSVAAMTSAGALSSFSNYGDLTVDLAAPGSSIMSTLPNGAYGSVSGTSMATPHVMGALALISSALPDATPQQCLDLLKQCVTYKADLAGKLAWDGWLDLGKLAALLAIDTPSVTGFAMSDTALKTGDTSTVTLTFSEAVAGLSVSDLSLSAAVGTVSDLTSTDGIHWTATLTPASNVEAQGVKLTVAAGSYTNANGSAAGQGFTSSPFAVDTKAPTVGITLSDNQLTTGETSTVTIAFSEVVSGFDINDVTVTNGALSGLASDDGRLWTATYTPSAGTMSAINSISVGNGYTDTAGNAGSVGMSANFTIDTRLSVDVVSIALSDTALKAGDTSTVTLTFTDRVTGLTLDDLSLSAAVGTLSNLTSTDGIIWTATLTPTANVEAQNVTLTVANGSYIGPNGTAVGRGFTSSPFSVDTKVPTVGITLSDNQLTTGETSTVTIAFSEVVSGFDINDVTVTNGALSGLASNDGRLWTATYTPSAGTLSAINSITIGNSYTDAAGNVGGVGASSNFTIDTRLFIHGTEGNDTLLGSANADVISGVPASTTLYGRASIDTLTGKGGRDVFVLGVTGRVFYDDGLAKKSGTNDFALITDFTAGVDKLQLASGKAYLYVGRSAAGTQGVGIVWDTDADGKLDVNSDELIAVLIGATAVSQSDIVMV